jgi:hypothetical protein
LPDDVGIQAHVEEAFMIESDSTTPMAGLHRACSMVGMVMSLVSACMHAVVVDETSMEGALGTLTYGERTAW